MHAGGVASKNPMWVYSMQISSLYILVLLCFVGVFVCLLVLLKLFFFLHLFSSFSSSFSSSSSTSPPAYSHSILYCSGPDMISA